MGGCCPWMPPPSSWTASTPPPKPRFRGRLHQCTFWLSLPAGALLILLSTHASSTVAASLYAASVALLFGTSAAYHRGKWTPRCATGCSAWTTP